MNFYWSGVGLQLENDIWEARKKGELSFVCQSALKRHCFACFQTWKKGLAHDCACMYNAMEKYSKLAFSGMLLGPLMWKTRQSQEWRCPTGLESVIGWTWAHRTVERSCHSLGKALQGQDWPQHCAKKKASEERKQSGSYLFYTILLFRSVTVLT